MGSFIDIRRGRKVSGDRMGMRLMLRQWAGQRPTGPTISRGSERKVPTLELRHGPNSYGEAAVRILVNGRKAEPMSSVRDDGPYGL